MSDGTSPSSHIFSDEQLTFLAESAFDTAQEHLSEFIATTQISFTDAAIALAVAALHEFEQAPQRARQWLRLARFCHTSFPAPASQAQIAYTEARFNAQSGEITQAEQLLRLAQDIWQALGDLTAVARTNLGLTQILTLQGRYDAALAASDSAVAALENATVADSTQLPLLVTALRNQANLYGYRHEHQRALAIYGHASQLLIEYRENLMAASSENAQIQDKLLNLDYEEACIAISRAVDLMALAHLQEAETALRFAVDYFRRAGNRHLESHTRSNLASLYARTGQYQAALSTFEEALQTLWPAHLPIDELPMAELQAADVMLLDQALVFLALNLRNQALHTLMLSEKLFVHAQRPYELGQTLYAQGLLYLQTEEWTAAATAFARAAETFAQLQNHYWHNRVILAQVTYLVQQADDEEATRLVATLIEGDPLDLDVQWYGWDLGTATELYLQRVQLHLRAQEVADARQTATTLAALFRLHQIDLIIPDTENETSNAGQTAVPVIVPHLQFAYWYALARIERAAGSFRAARRIFQHAVMILESQRATLPLEEIRIAFLSDKIAIYTDWLLTLLDAPTVTDQELFEAFAIVERARSRTLLERLLVALEQSEEQRHQASDRNAGDDSATDDGQQSSVFHADVDSPSRAKQRELAQQHLHWLYNQLLGQDGARRLESSDLERIRQLEFRLEQLTSRAALPSMAWPVDLAALQAILPPHDHVLAYYIAGTEVLLFSVTATAIKLYRRLCSLHDVKRAWRDLQFQMGRVHSGQLLLQDLDNRAQRLLRQALHRLYQLLVEPVAAELTQQRIRIVPYGLLHQLPFHIFWTGDKYLIEEFACSYVPSASIIVHQAKQATTSTDLRRWAGLAVTDQNIPETVTEVAMVSQLFDEPQLYIGAHADRSGLTQAAHDADILHISTHGLMRSDNPLFSSLKLTDDWISVRDIYRLDLRARLVILSACRSGLSRIEQGDEMIGIARGFLGAGAQTLVVSQWDVNDTYVPPFMYLFYQQLIAAQQDPAAALRYAQCHAIQEGHHPFWWGPFYVIG